MTMKNNEAGTTTRRTGRTALLRTAGTIISLGLLVFLLSNQGWQEILTALKKIPAWVFLVSLMLMLVSRLAVTARWHVLLRAAPFDIGYRQTLQITFAGLFATNFLPTTIGGDVVRLAGMVRQNHDGARSTASLIVDRLIGLLGMVMVIPLALPALKNAGGLDQLLQGSRSSKDIFSPAIVLPAWLANLWGKVKKFLQDILQALAIWIKKPTSLLISFAFTWVNMLCFYAIFNLLLNNMGETVNFWLIGGLYSLIYFFTLLPISINGYGLQELSITVVFSSLAGVSVGSALTMALLFRTTMMIASLPGAFTLPGVMGGKTEDAGTQPSDTAK